MHSPDTPVDCDSLVVSVASVDACIAAVQIRWFFSFPLWRPCSRTHTLGSTGKFWCTPSRTVLRFQRQKQGGGGGWILSTCGSLAIYSPHLMFVIAHQTAFIQVSLSVSLSRTLFLSLPLSLSLARSPFLSLALFLSLSDHSLFLCAVRFSPDLIPHNL